MRYLSAAPRALVLVLVGWCTAMSQTGSHGVQFVGRLWFPSIIGSSDTTGGSDCWGYTAPDGTEYAMMGVRDGIAVVNAGTMQVITIVPGPTTGDAPYKHRDIKTYRHYAYAVAEMTGNRAGLMVMDMQYLPDSVHFVRSFTTATDVRSHNFTIDTTMGFAYILKSNYSGFRMVSLADPENPVEVGVVNTLDIHDVFARRDTVWVAEGNRHTFSLYDVSNKSAPRLILRKAIQNSGYVHNIWPTDEGRYAITTEETGYKTVKIWDVSDTANVTVVGEYLGSNNLAHNVQVKGNRVFISHYQAGVTVIDISTPSMPVEVAYFDTYPRGNSPNFNGCWGAYPYTQNGIFYASDIEGYLTVLRLDSSFTDVRSGDVPLQINLSQNYPNPFNPSTTIEYALNRSADVSLRVFDVLGCEVDEIEKGTRGAGVHRVKFDASGLASGVYFYRLRVTTSNESFDETKRFVFLK